jgi:hypothetical protein
MSRLARPTVICRVKRIHRAERRRDDGHVDVRIGARRSARPGAEQDQALDGDASSRQLDAAAVQQLCKLVWDLSH